MFLSTIMHWIGHSGSGRIQYTRSKDNKILLFHSHKAACRYRDQHYGYVSHGHFVLEVDVPKIRKDHQLISTREVLKGK